MKQQGLKQASTEHGQVYHAALGCQGKRSGLTAESLRGRKRLCSVASKKTAGVFAAHKNQSGARVRRVGSGRSFGVSALSSLKGRSLIATVGEPHGIDDPDPDIGQGSDGDGMTLAFCSLAPVEGQRPGFCQGRLL